MTRPYSVRFVSTSLREQWVDYVVPSGRRAVVRLIQTVNWGAGGATTYVHVANLDIFVAHLPGGEGTSSLETRLTAYAGEAIGCFLRGEVVTCQLHGFLFSDEYGPADEPDLMVPGDRPPPGVDVPPWPVWT